MQQTKSRHEELLKVLKNRFSKNMHRHKGIEWARVEKSLKVNEKKLGPLYAMEQTGGEPDVVCLDEKADEIIFVDCSKESPKGRRSVCYDDEALESRKANKPANSARGMAAEMGVKLLDNEQYFALQKIENFDTKTSSWLLTPENVRSNGGALFGDFRYGQTFIYHNGAESYYAARGFRCSLSM